METSASPRGEIRRLQTYLRQLSYHDSDMASPPIDGIFGATTRQALCIFQQKAGLPVSGTATRETWEALYDAYRLSLAQEAPPCPVSVFPTVPDGYRLTVGCTGFPVTVLQHLLIELQSMTGDEIPVGCTGTYDRATADAVLRLQRCFGLPQDGEVDRATWDAIAEKYNEAFARGV